MNIRDKNTINILLCILHKAGYLRALFNYLIARKGLRLLMAPWQVKNYF